LPRSSFPVLVLEVVDRLPAARGLAADELLSEGDRPVGLGGAGRTEVDNLLLVLQRVERF